MENKIPAVSVVIPMYNAEKYIGACLESIFAQTFKDFEIVVVDDCSTDKSCSIVEKYLKRGGQIKLVRSKKNFGNPGVPRNIGISFSRGKYIQFVDNDDLLMNNALEVLFNFAESYDVDVVCSHSHYIFDVETEKPFPTKLRIDPPIFDKPFIESENVALRLNDHNAGKIRLIPWLNFARRDFLIEKEIYFPEIKLSEDDFWILKLITRAKKILCIPNALCINRNNANSITRTKRTTEQQVGTYMTPTIAGMKFLKEIFDETEFFRQNPQYWYACVSRIVNYNFRMIFNHCANLNPYQVYEIFHQQFAEETGEHSELISYLCSMINFQQKQLAFANMKITEFEKQLRK